MLWGMASQLHTKALSGVGRRTYTPSTVPGRDALDDDVWPEQHDALVREWDAYQSARDRKNKTASERKTAEGSFVHEAAQAQRDGRDYKDPRLAKVKADEAAEVSLAVAEQVLLDRTEEIDWVRAEHRDLFAECITNQKTSAGEVAVRLIDELDDAFMSFSEARRAAAWLNDVKPPPPIGSKHTNALEREVRDLLDPPRIVYVRQADRAKLAEGHDVLDVDGAPVASEDVEARRVLVKIAHSVGPLRDSPVGRVSDRG